MIQRIINFLQVDLWKMPLEGKPGWYAFFIRQIRIINVAFKGFNENRVNLRASALTFYTLLSMVPIVAMGFGVAAGFGFDQKMEEFIIANFKGQEEVMNWIINMSYDVLEGVEGGLLAGIGLILLIWSVMQVLTNIESSFNAIWQIKKSRSFMRKMTDYLAIMLIAPLLIILSSSISVYISTRIESVAQNVEVIQTVSPYLDSAFRLLPYTLVWLVFTLIYMIMPNTRVNFKYALIAGIIAGTVFQVTQWAYIHFQVGVTTYSAFYGTFAALPLFLAWLQVSWLIVLLGAEISFAYQNVRKFEFEAGTYNISNNEKKLLSLFIMRTVIKNFQEGKEPFTTAKISLELGIPLRLVRDSLFDLVKAGILNETLGDNQLENGYQPSIDINRIDIKFILDRLDGVGADHVILHPSEEWQRLVQKHQELISSMNVSPSNVLLKDL
jgi:membrane protein